MHDIPILVIYCLDDKKKKYLYKFAEDNGIYHMNYNSKEFPINNYVFECKSYKKIYKEEDLIDDDNLYSDIVDGAYINCRNMSLYKTPSYLYLSSNGESGS